MSYTTLYKINQDGNVVEAFDFSNAWGGAMFIWEQLAEKYIDYKLDADERRIGISKFSLMLARNDLKMVWHLANDHRVPFDERIVLATTFDHVVVRGSDLLRVADALDAFVAKYPPGDRACSICHQAEALRSLAAEGALGCAWNQTSASSSFWRVQEGDGDRPRNVDNDEGHWWLFDEVAETIEVEG